MTAVVIPVRPGEDNPELRFALRSIAAYVPDPDIWIVGHRPRWVHNVHWIPTHPVGSKSDRGCQQTRAAAEHVDAPNAFWWWDDDMFRLAPMPPTPEHHHGGPVADWLARFERFDSQYARALRRTAGLKIEPDALFYDLHVPFWIGNRHALADTMHLLPDGRGGWLWRTVHGNRQQYGGERMTDVKVYRDDPIPDPLGAWLSSDNAAYPRLEPVLQRMFPTPSRWEGTPDQGTALVGRYVRGDTTRDVPFRPDTDRTLAVYGWQRVELVPAERVDA